jgi:D-sedoheptulose 7-phosphate isomerase
VGGEGNRQVEAFFARSLAALELAARDPGIVRTIADIAEVIGRSFAAGGKLLIAGNGGSAADAQHLSTEFLSRFVSDRRPLPAVALTTDTSALTAIGNDYGFDHVFERQVRALGRSQDVFLAISTSGKSRNVVLALQAAREAGLTTMGFTGAGGEVMRALCDHCLMVASTETAIIQQIHIVAGHAVCGLVERALLEERSAR